MEERFWMRVLAVLLFAFRLARALIFGGALWAGAAAFGVANFWPALALTGAGAVLFAVAFVVNIEAWRQIGMP